MYVRVDRRIGLHRAYQRDLGLAGVDVDVEAEDVGVHQIEAELLPVQAAAEGRGHLVLVDGQHRLVGGGTALVS